MGLFNLLKNGLTIEKKKKPTEPEPVQTEEPTPAEAEIDEPVITAPAPAPMPNPVIEKTSEEKRMAAEYILYGDTNVAPTNPAPIPETPKAPEPVTNPIQQPIQQTYNAYTNVTSHFNNALLGQATANQNLLVIAPKSPDEMSPILSNLTSGNACIVSLANMPDPQRHLDYLCGFMNAIGGTIRQHTQTEYILTPPGVGIKSKN